MKVLSHHLLSGLSVTALGYKVIALQRENKSNFKTVLEPAAGTCRRSRKEKEEEKEERGCNPRPGRVTILLTVVPTGL